MTSHDILVVGAGHAGIEAALAASRMGARVLVLTMSRESIGRMSCNPAIGGVAKGQIVREIDALGGEMAKATDATGIQFRMLNTGKGPAVRSPRAQCDKELYSRHMRCVLESAPNVEIVEDTIEALDVAGDRVAGAVGREGRRYPARAVILTTGTFLKGLMHCGEQKNTGGRIHEPSAERLSDHLRALGFEIGRLKTGTPPRLHRDSIDYARLQVQPGDDPPTPFSHSTDRLPQPQVVCWITYTNERVHEAIRANLHRAPMYSGQIQGRGPRYCPSIEDKVVRFAEKARHQIFLEPEGLDTESIYVNGISTSLPPDVQDEVVHGIEGLERAKILRYGYAVEYDFASAHQLHPTLETRRVGGLYFAGQINGTSGYEEAAGQGFVAGVNAALALAGEPPFVLSRSEAYVGVLVDDLVTMEIAEPYRMFTSRAEFRLLLRTDNADRRLMPRGRELGLVGDAAWRAFQEKERAIAAAREALRKTGLEQALRRPEVRFAEVADRLPPTPPGAAEQVEVEVKYEGYIARALRQVERLKRLEDRAIPPTMDFARMPHLKKEARETLARIRPSTLAQATRLPGVTPADLQVVMAFLD